MGPGWGGYGGGYGGDTNINETNIYNEAPDSNDNDDLIDDFNADDDYGDLRDGDFDEYDGGDDAGGYGGYDDGGFDGGDFGGDF